jgi:hypothetical protein
MFTRIPTRDLRGRDTGWPVRGTPAGFSPPGLCFPPYR